MRSLVRGAALLIAAAAMSACATLTPHAPPVRTAAPQPARAPAAPPPATKLVRVYVPKPVRCVPEDLGPPPAYPDSDQALRDAGGAADRYQLLAAGRLLREQRLQKLEEAVRRCRNAAR